MAQGYWEKSYWPDCVCCSSGPKAKFICLECLHVCKAPRSWTPHCPKCRTKVQNMGQRWRPERKNKRTVPEVHQQYRYPSPGETLLEKILEKGKR